MDRGSAAGSHSTVTITRDGVDNDMHVSQMTNRISQMTNRIRRQKSMETVALLNDEQRHHWSIGRRDACIRSSKDQDRFLY